MGHGGGMLELDDDIDGGVGVSSVEVRGDLRVAAKGCSHRKEQKDSKSDDVPQSRWHFEPLFSNEPVAGERITPYLSFVVHEIGAFTRSLDFPPPARLRA